MIITDIITEGRILRVIVSECFASCGPVILILIDKLVPLLVAPVPWLARGRKRWVVADSLVCPSRANPGILLLVIGLGSNHRREGPYLLLKNDSLVSILEV